MLSDATRDFLMREGIELKKEDAAILAAEGLENEIPKSVLSMKDLGMTPAQIVETLMRDARAEKTKRTVMDAANVRSGGSKPAKVEVVRIFTRRDCQYCDYAKELLTERGIAFDERDATDDPVLRGWIAWATGQRTLPQVFIGGEPIGGFADLMTLDATGELKRKVAQAIAGEEQ